MIRFVHQCYVPQPKDAKGKDQPAKLFKAGDTVEESSLPPEWLAGSLEHGFVERVEPEPPAEGTSP